MKTQNGFTLIELMITLGIFALLAMIAMPSMERTGEKRRVQGAAESLYGMLMYARSEAIKRSRDIYFRTAGETTTNWAFGLTDNATGCDPSLTDAANTSACTLDFDNDPATDDPFLVRADSEDFSGVTMGSGNNITYSWINSTATSTGYTFSSGDYQLRVVVGKIGRVRLCIPNGSGAPAIGGYVECP